MSRHHAVTDLPKRRAVTTFLRQVHTDHLERFGAYEIPRLRYLELLKIALDEPTKRGKWEIELDPVAFAASGGAITSSA